MALAIVQKEAPTPIPPDDLPARLAAAQGQVAQAQAEALAAALHDRDLRYAAGLGIHAPGDARVRDAEAAYRQAAKSLERARAAVRRIEQEAARTAEQVNAAAAAAAQERRMAWARAHHPQLVDALTQATATLADLRADRYAPSSTAGQAAIWAASRQVQVAQAALDRAAQATP